jgi:hypothetical protein
MSRRHSNQALIDAVLLVSRDASLKATGARDSEREHIRDCLSEIIEMLHEAERRRREKA